MALWHSEQARLALEAYPVLTTYYWLLATC